jgi:hypothetical protein
VQVQLPEDSWYVPEKVSEENQVAWILTVKNNGPLQVMRLLRRGAGGMKTVPMKLIAG